MKLVVNNLYTTAEATSEELNILRGLLAVEIEGSEFSPAFQQGFWDGKFKFMDKTSNVLPSGLVEWCKDALMKKGIDVQVEDKRVAPTIDNDWEALLGDIEERDYQYELTRKAVQDGQGILHCATNAGKTEMAATIIKAINLPTLFLVHRITLLDQTVKRLQERLGVHIGVISSDKMDIQDITVAMVPTLVKKLKNVGISYYLKQVQVVMADECHHASADTWLACMKACKNAFFRFGLSGTPFKDLLSNLKLMSVTGPVIGRITNKFLIDNGYSAKPTIYIAQYPFDFFNYDWATAYEQCIVYSEQRNAVLAYFASLFAEDGLPTLITCGRIDQGEILKNVLLSIGVTCDFLHGEHSSKERQEAKTKLSNKEIQVLIATTIFDEGEDVPDIRALILAGGSKSEIANLQRIGRGLRRKDEDNSLIVLDIYDSSNSYLEDHSKERIKLYKREGFDVEILDKVPRVY